MRGKKTTGILNTIDNNQFSFLCACSPYNNIVYILIDILKNYNKEK